jgi:hypothetical protein
VVFDGLEAFTKHNGQVSSDLFPPKMSQSLRSLGVPQTCLVYEGLYGVGFYIVQSLCAIGVERIVVLSQFSPSTRTQQRFDQLKRFAKFLLFAHFTSNLFLMYLYFFF